MERFLIAAILGFAASGVLAQAQVGDAWVRATVPQQKASGAFMRLSSPTDARLVAASSPLAGVVEMHEMAMEKDVMRMRAVPKIDIPAARGAKLKPGGRHLMLLELKRQLKEGETVPITLVIEHQDGRRQTLEVRAPVRPLAAGGHVHGKPGH
jgi:hypothetical protein